MPLRITEIFYSLQGEATRVGLPTVFVRLTGCPLRCVWCDTTYSFTGGEPASIESVLAEVAKYPVRQVCVTGGEPLSQKDCLPLLSALSDAGYDVSLETSGALDIAPVDPRVSRIMDLKAPDSGESAKNRWENLAVLQPRDEIKIVIASRADYEWARQVLREHRLDQLCPVLLSPAQGLVEARALAEWILEDGLNVRFQMQLHKLLWGNIKGK
ncbi:7-carboxy-7-deazaguanine synthase QueE [Dechloromonas denitrificans]|uniref:7-carboxy-7-deazaguanine synthase QueE n=1 Tax=Dechloromonas denitrificans TaxID=281362 RepID=UPI001CF8ED23|nr:7-carboxy-7-deazaguanine synthase QueE [Dechloromonas denitrificans]UCV03565.1 7-carboxy-7-deazaguanine synthase QueE [Dechloromonas denitrificans]UCV07826.1 7-carboxy-7-deazaguanine synthase QueE [Dechloromonas denitrificans]